MINWNSILSVFDGKMTLLQWLKSVEQALKNASVTSITVTQATAETAKFILNLSDGTTVESDPITLPAGAQGERGPAGPQGIQGAIGREGPTDPAASKDPQDRKARRASRASKVRKALTVGALLFQVKFRQRQSYRRPVPHI